jgi:hypothetical protein
MEEEKTQFSMEEIKSLLKESEIENQQEQERKNNLPVNYKQIRTGILVFIIIQLLFEICMIIIFSANAKYIGLHLIFNYLFSSLYAKRKLEKKQIPKETNLFNYGFRIALIIFSVRLILGIVISLFI